MHFQSSNGTIWISKAPMELNLGEIMAWDRPPLIIISLRFYEGISDLHYIIANIIDIFENDIIFFANRIFLLKVICINFFVLSFFPSRIKYLDVFYEGISNLHYIIANIIDIFPRAIPMECPGYTTKKSIIIIIIIINF